MQRIVVPLIGGMISSTLLTLIVIPATDGLVKGFGLPGGERKRSPVNKGGKSRSIFRMILNAKCVDRIPVFGISIGQ